MDWRLGLCDNRDKSIIAKRNCYRDNDNVDILIAIICACAYCSHVVQSIQGLQASHRVTMASNVEYLPLEKAKCPVWKYFGFPAQEGKFLEPDKKKRQTVHCVLSLLCKQ